MAGRKILLLAVAVTIIIIIDLHNVEGRGGRGGGSRGGSRSSGSRWGSRSSTGTRSTSKVRYYRGPKYTSSMWKAGLAVGVVYGLMSYKRRSIYLRSPEREPSICFNEDNLRNGTYGYFICPEPDLPDNYSYCCGDEGEQECCTYTKYQEYKQEKAVGAIVGGIVGVIVLAVIVVLVVYCCVIRKRRRRHGEIKKGQVLSEQQPLNHAEGTPMQTFHGSGPTPVCPPAPYGAPPMAPSTGYGPQEGLPYNPSPVPPEQCPPYAGPPIATPDPIGFKDGSDGLPYSAHPTHPGVGPGGFVQPGPGYPPQEEQPYLPPPGVPSAPPPPYPGN